MSTMSAPLPSQSAQVLPASLGLIANQRAVQSAPNAQTRSSQSTGLTSSSTQPSSSSSGPLLVQMAIRPQVQGLASQLAGLRPLQNAASLLAVPTAPPALRPVQSTAHPRASFAQPTAPRPIQAPAVSNATGSSYPASQRPATCNLQGARTYLPHPRPAQGDSARLSESRMPSAGQPLQTGVSAQQHALKQASPRAVQITQAPQSNDVVAAAANGGSRLSNSQGPPNAPSSAPQISPPQVDKEGELCVTLISKFARGWSDGICSTAMTSHM